MRPLLSDEIVNGTYCLEAKQKIGDIWTYGLVFSCTGPLVFGSLVNVIGSAWTRVLAGSSTTVGLLLMSFYKSFPSLLLPGVILGMKNLLQKIIILDFSRVSVNRLDNAQHFYLPNLQKNHRHTHRRNPWAHQLLCYLHAHREEALRVFRGRR